MLISGHEDVLQAARGWDGATRNEYYGKTAWTDDYSNMMAAFFGRRSH
jgi:hypothetical protein